MRKPKPRLRARRAPRLPPRRVACLKLVDDAGRPLVIEIRLLRAYGGPLLRLRFPLALAFAVLGSMIAAPSGPPRAFRGKAIKEVAARKGGVRMPDQRSDPARGIVTQMGVSSRRRTRPFGNVAKSVIRLYRETSLQGVCFVVSMMRSGSMLINSVDILRSCWKWHG